MDVSAQYLTLQNDNFMERHVKFYKKIREEEDLFDVTIACDGAEVRAHKLIMSASSPLFKRIIKNSNHPNQYIYLHKLHPQDLTSIINFVYTGETKVEANSIQRFMTSASDLQISGLVSEAPSESPDKVEAEYDEELVKTPSRTKKTLKRKSAERETPLEIAKFAKQVEDTSQEEEEEDIDTNFVNDFLQVKEEAEVEEDSGPGEQSTNTTNDNPNADVNDALEKEIEKRMEKIQDSSGQKLTKCTVCGKTFKQKSKAKFHIETHVEGFSHKCTICGATAKTKKSLSVHIYNRHTKANKHQE